MLGDNEYITAIEGSANEVIDELFLRTSFGRVFRIGKNKRGKFFRLSSNNKVVANLSYAFGIYLHKIGATFDMKKSKNYRNVNYRTMNYYNRRNISLKRSLQSQRPLLNHTQMVPQSVNYSNVSYQSNRSFINQDELSQNSLSHLQPEPKPVRTSRMGRNLNMTVPSYNIQNPYHPRVVNNQSFNRRYY